MKLNYFELSQYVINCGKDLSALVQYSVVNSHNSPMTQVLILSPFSEQETKAQRRQTTEGKIQTQACFRVRDFDQHGTTLERNVNIVPSSKLIKTTSSLQRVVKLIKTTLPKSLLICGNESNCPLPTGASCEGSRYWDAILILESPSFCLFDARRRHSYFVSNRYFTKNKAKTKMFGSSSGRQWPARSVPEPKSVPVSHEIPPPLCVRGISTRYGIQGRFNEALT